MKKGDDGRRRRMKDEKDDEGLIVTASVHLAQLALAHVPLATEGAHNQDWGSWDEGVPPAVAC